MCTWHSAQKKAAAVSRVSYGIRINMQPQNKLRGGDRWSPYIRERKASHVYVEFMHLSGQSSVLHLIRQRFQKHAVCKGRAHVICNVSVGEEPAE